MSIHSSRDKLLLKTMIKLTEIESRPHNIGFAIWRVKCYYETFVQDSTSVILLNFCAKMPPHRKAVNRSAPCNYNQSPRRFMASMTWSHSLVHTAAAVSGPSFINFALMSLISFRSFIMARAISFSNPSGFGITILVRCLVVQPMAYWPLTHESTAQNMHLCGILPTHNRCSRRIAAGPLAVMLGRQCKPEH